MPCWRMPQDRRADRLRLSRHDHRSRNRAKPISRRRRAAGAGFRGGGARVFSAIRANPDAGAPCGRRAIRERSPHVSRRRYHGAVSSVIVRADASGRLVARGHTRGPSLSGTRHSERRRCVGGGKGADPHCRGSRAYRPFGFERTLALSAFSTNTACVFSKARMSTRNAAVRKPASCP